MLFSATSTEGTFVVAQTLVTNFLPAIIFICGILFFVLIVSIMVKMSGGEIKEDFNVEHDDLFTDEI